MADVSSDIFDEDGDVLQVEEVAWSKMKNSRLKEGFVEGKCQGEETTLQEGFNKGYEKGFQYNFPVAEIRGVIGALKSYLKKSDLSCWQQIQEIADELTQLEHNVIETRRISTSNDKNIKENAAKEEGIETALDVGTKQESMKTNTENPETSCVSIKREYNDEDCEIILAQFHSLKEKTVNLLEECGFSKLSQLIAHIFILK